MAQKWTSTPDVMVTRLTDETVLLDTRTRAMFSLNESGQIVWENLDFGLDVMVAKLTQTFQVSDSEARIDALAVLDALIEAGLIAGS